MPGLPRASCLVQRNPLPNQNECNARITLDQLHRYIFKVSNQTKKLRGVPKDSRANDPRNCWMVLFMSLLATPPPGEPGNKNNVFSGFS